VRRVAILTAMVPEMRPLVRDLSLAPGEVGEVTGYRGRYDGLHVVAAVTSMGTVAARRVTEAVLDAGDVDWALMVGIAGGVDPALTIGQLVMPVAVVDAVTGDEHRPSSTHGWTPRGKLMTTDELLNDPDDLRALLDRDVIALDMETAAVAAVCEARGCDWSVFRAISDRAGDPRTDAAVVGLAKPDGSADLAAVARYVGRRPWKIPHLATLGRGMNRATHTAARAALDALGAL
jgi:adenosylhomocysteine nucleosidase